MDRIGCRYSELVAYDKLLRKELPVLLDPRARCRS